MGVRILSSPPKSGESPLRAKTKPKKKTSKPARNKILGLKKPFFFAFLCTIFEQLAKICVAEKNLKCKLRIDPTEGHPVQNKHNQPSPGTCWLVRTEASIAIPGTFLHSDQVGEALLARSAKVSLSWRDTTSAGSWIGLMGSCPDGRGSWFCCS